MPLPVLFKQRPATAEQIPKSAYGPRPWQDEPTAAAVAVARCLASCELVPLADTRLAPRTSGLYVVTYRRRLVYIGRAAEIVPQGGLQRRVGNARRTVDRSRLRLSWAQYVTLAMPAAELLAVEPALIDWYRPYWNLLGGFGASPYVVAARGSRWHDKYGA